MPSPEQLEYADLLLSKATGDLAAARALADARGVGDDIVGFHAQQATEKALKATLAIAGVEIPLTHDVDYLVELAEDAGWEPPEPVREAGWLSPWAVQFRYEGTVEELDRSAAILVAAVAVDWTRALTHEADA